MKSFVGSNNMKDFCVTLWQKYCPVYVPRRLLSVVCCGSAAEINLLI